MVYNVSKYVRERFPDAVLISNGYMYFIKSARINGYNLGTMSPTPEGAWTSALNHVRCM
jgi:hypothetical protein